MLEFLKNLFGGTDLRPIIANGALILDVRTEEEFKTGSVAGAKNIPLGDLGKNIDDLKKLKKPIVTCCASGSRSDAAVRQLQSYRIEAYNGGSWQKVKKMVS